MYAPSITELYRLPYSKNDNPNGWIEITTMCNLKCPGCYRGCNRPENIGKHEPLDKIKEEILQLEKIRNCKIISISGGEPLMHPKLSEIIDFITQQGMQAFVHTNGLLLTVDLIKKLKLSGMVGLIIRLDSLMEEKKNHTEIELNTKRQKWAEMVSSVKNINLGFISVVNHKNLNEITEVIRWAQQNAEVVDFLTLIPIRQVVFDKSEVLETSNWVTLEEMCQVIHQEFPNLKYASYLGSQLENSSIKWLQAGWMIKGGVFVDYIDKKFIEAILMIYHYKYGKYSYVFKNGRNQITFTELLFLSLLVKTLRTSILKLILKVLCKPSLLFKKNIIQILSFTIPPGFVDGERDLCDACPDAMLYNGKLVPSCGLEEIKTYGKPLSSNLFDKSPL
ncbi:MULTISPECIES: radical SAM protein [unclassified Saccharicrinis]|uniref:radical SAM protein n=1 Tax=unclassified Saccharicrinis TaxID=2646859 RepID=UPI003D33A2EC